MSSPCYDLSSFSLLFSLFLLIDHFPASSRFTRTVVELALQSVLFHLFDLTSLFLIVIIYDNTYIYTTVRDVSSRRVSSFSLGGSVSIGAPGWACISCSINQFTNRSKISFLTNRKRILNPSLFIIQHSS